MDIDTEIHTYVHTHAHISSFLTGIWYYLLLYAAYTQFDVDFYLIALKSSAAMRGYASSLSLYIYK